MILLKIILLLQKTATPDFISFWNFSSLEVYFMWITLCISTKKSRFKIVVLDYDQRFKYLRHQVDAIKFLKIKYLEKSFQLLLTRSEAHDMLVPSFP